MSTPIERFRASLARAESLGSPMPIAMALATTDADGTPSVRMVLCRGVDERGFVFFTNLRSRKGQALEARPTAALCFWWPPLEEQVRVEGTVEHVTAEEADAYWATRPRGSRLASAASPQSAPMASRDEYEAAVAELDRKYAGEEVPRPPEWSGYRVIPSSIEFWHGRPDRMHDRVLFTRDGDGWRETLLYP